MRRKNRTTLLSVFVSVVLFATVSLYVNRDAVSGPTIRPPTILRNLSNTVQHLNLAIREELHIRSLQVSTIRDLQPPDSILLPDWEVLVVTPEIPLSSGPGNRYYCLFQNNATSTANFAGFLPFSNLTTFKCVLPNRVRRLRPFVRPILAKSPGNWPGNESEMPGMLRWDFLAYESLSTENDVILFVKGVNNRQGVNPSPAKFRCVFGDSVTNGVKTDVFSSAQEVFRCLHPNKTALLRLFPGGEERIRVSLEIGEEQRVVPSVAYYTPDKISVAKREAKALLCACTMGYNVAKFLKEWVVYHSKIGVEKFIVYDNGSDDNLERVVEELLEEYINVETLSWPWPKTQEAGFSHCAIHARDSCEWMMYIDVDEFVFSPSWLNSSHPSSHMLRSFLPIMTPHPSSSSSSSIGQISIRCFEFGPSNQGSHPMEGVTQGYTCRRRVEQRHKSLVLLDAIDTSLLNVIHHFELKEGYRVERLSKEEGVVNHYKYQAWSEFKAKFRRRVSAYVADWRQEVNPNSKDRTPGLGYVPIEPKGWAMKFCEVNDSRLKVATQKWFGLDLPSGYKMAWQR
ncbi:hypothetical protein HHK36_010452 [Tetracentron sinense]|uniref:Glycosyltransferase family 92 protein n=1 Tax=Tetracentron sinense TaxID=13715 RepID=A0A834ZE97_TETSI|nr:hypothetical protein HHK36_010452 [Tetracentron sinense]